MEILELPDHPYFLGTQFHPEFRSRPTRASPPFVGLLDAALDRQDGEHPHGARDDETDAEEVEL
jgi:CTP synthase